MRKTLILSLLLAGCATLGNTPKQDRTYAAWAACQAEGRIGHGIQLTRVEADGRYWWRASTDSTAGFGEVKECMREQFAKLPNAK